jgi:hypothetical protein
MGDPETKAKHSASRRRNFIVKKLHEINQFSKKIHMSKKDREKQRQWRLENDIDGDYESVDDWLMKGEK